jgi:hypothetical protein
MCRLGEIARAHLRSVPVQSNVRGAKHRISHVGFVVGGLLKHAIGGGFEVKLTGGRGVGISLDWRGDQGKG